MAKWGRKKKGKGKSLVNYRKYLEASRGGPTKNVGKTEKLKFSRNLFVESSSELKRCPARLEARSDDSYTHIDYMDTAYFDLLLKFGPIRRNRNGRGVQSNDNPAKRDVAPCIVKALYICNAKSG